MARIALSRCIGWLNNMIYGSVCSGIEAATVAWHPLGWKPAFFSEIEKFPREVLAHHYPAVPLHGDFTTIKKGDYEPIELLVGGTPCQSFSVAGLRKGLADPRGNLMLEFGSLARRLGTKWLVWENVPGVLSSNGGKDFGSFIAMLAELGYGFAYRVLDAQYFGVAQRRRRVFVVGCFGDWRSAAAVLFERDSLQGNPAPSRKEGEKPAKCITRGVGQRYDFETEDFIVFNQQASASQGLSISSNTSPTIDKSKVHGILHMLSVRRMMPIEYERLQGFDDNYTNVPSASDTARYKALGNSMAVPVMRWIGERIEMVSKI